MYAYKGEGNVNPPRLFIVSVFVLICAGVSAQIHVTKGDTTKTERTVDLNPVVVTGSGHHQRLKSAVTPVQVITANDIKERGVSTFEDAMTRIMPQVSLAPNSMGSQIRLNGLGNKYILVLINGRKLSGDISNNVDLNRINMSRVRRIEVLDGAASSLYGSDAIGGVINIITDQPTSDMLSATSDTHISGEGRFTQSVNVDIFKGGFGSTTSFVHEEANSYRTNDYEYITDGEPETQRSIAPLYNGYNSNLLSQHFTYSPARNIAFNAGIEGSYKITDRPETNDDITGGTSYEMRYKGLRWNVGGVYKFNAKNSLQVDFLVDRYRYGKEYDVATSSYDVGDYVQSKRQKTLDAEAKGVLGIVTGGTTVVGFNWHKDFLEATSGEIDDNAYSLAGYLQHEQTIARNFKATAGVRYTHHETAGDHFTPKAGLMYSPGRFIFRASYSMGFRSPGLDELYYRYFSVNKGTAQVSFGNKDLDPETSNYFSIGVEYHSPIVTVGVSGFMNFIDDMIIKDNIALDDEGRAMLMAEFPDMTQDEADGMTQYARYINSDKGEVKGIQANLAVTPFAGFDITASYAYIYARTKTDGEWELLDRSIKNTVTVAANYRHRWGGYTLNVNVNGRMQSKTYYSSYENAPGYGLWNINTTHTFEGLENLLIEPSIGIDNIFDKVDDRIDSDSRKYALYSPGRMITFGLKVKFM